MSNDEILWWEAFAVLVILLIMGFFEWWVYNG